MIVALFVLSNCVLYSYPIHSLYKGVYNPRFYYLVHTTKLVLVKNISYFFLLIILGGLIKVKAQERPPINNFSLKDYNAASQNWAISQSEKHHIYAANNKGLLEYNGAKWNLYKSPTEAIIREVQVIDSLIYTGSYRDFGYWKRDNFGVLNYTSLSKELKVNFLEDEEFWNIEALGNSMCFQSLDRIHIYNKASKSYTALNLGFTYNLVSIFFNLDVSGATVGSDKTYYFDDVMFGAAVLSTADFSKSTYNTFPNPTQNSWTIKSQNKSISSISVFNVLGKQVLFLTPNTDEVTINGSGLKSGIYFAQIKTSTGVNSIKLIKQ